MNYTTNRQENVSALVVEYTDALEGFKGWLVIDSLEHSLCAGGMRVQKGLSKEHVTNMARNMTRKMRICGLPIDGAKCGIDYDNCHPGKLAAMTRFMKAIKPLIQERYSMGPDLNTDMDELEAAAIAIQLPSIKIAIAKAQGMKLPYFMERYAILSKEVTSHWTLGKIRAGYGVAAAALATLDFLKIPYADATVAVQGFGNLAKATILGLIEAGVKIIALADIEKCLLITTDQDNVLEELLSSPGTLLRPTLPSQHLKVINSSSIVEVACDILILAAVENTINKKNSSLIQAKAVVPGANLAVSRAAEKILDSRGIPVLPCFLAGCGGSLSMNGLFAPAQHPSPKSVLQFVRERMRAITTKTLQKSVADDCTATEAAEEICRSEEIAERTRPYEF